MTIKQAIAIAKQKIAHVSDIPQKEAAILLSHATGLTQTELFTKESQEFESDKFFELVHRRAEHEPVEYITGIASFYSRDFLVSPSCLIPRPETELLIDMLIEEYKLSGFSVVADICTGSGCIGIALAKELPDVQILAVDISLEALEVARKNVAKHCVFDRVKLLQGDLLVGVPACDIIVSNPPYIADSFELPTTVKFEPSLALFAGKDGADLLKSLICQFATHSARALFCEFGFDQRDIVQNFCRQFGFASVEFYRDYAGLDRGFVIKK